MLDLAGQSRGFAEAAIRSHLGDAECVAAMSTGRHHLFHARTGDGRQFVVKMYKPTFSLFQNLEIAGYAKLRGRPFIRECFTSSCPRDGDPAFIITEYVEGHTLLDRIQAGDLSAADERAAVRSIVDFVRCCTGMEVSGFGELNEEWGGRRAAWSDFLDHYLASMDTAIAQLPPGTVRSVMQHGLGKLVHFCSRQSEFLRQRPATLVPVDLNLTNFLIGTDGRLVVLDLESFLAGDPLLALGEWTGHTFGTTRCEAFTSYWGPLGPDEEACVRGYALMSNLDVLLYVVSNQVGDPETARPWGNPHPFVDLIREHAGRLS